MTPDQNKSILRCWFYYPLRPISATEALIWAGVVIACLHYLRRWLFGRDAKSDRVTNSNIYDIYIYLYICIYTCTYICFCIWICDLHEHSHKQLLVKMHVSVHLYAHWFYAWIMTCTDTYRHSRNDWRCITSYTDNRCCRKLAYSNIKDDVRLVG